MKIVAIMQARMGSTRFPGKVLKQVLGKPLLAYQLERVNRSELIDEILVATTTQKKDDEIALFCEKMDINYYRGTEADVLKRYYMAAVQMQADVIVRLTSDCPLIDPRQIDQVIQHYVTAEHPLMYVSNTIKRTWPRGMDTEVFSFQALERADEQAVSPTDREHVTSYMINHPKMFHLSNVAHVEDLSHHRWTVDTVEDFTLIQQVIETLYPNQPAFTMEDVLQVLEDFPEWTLINRHINQKES